jgi:hypothetical protein
MRTYDFTNYKTTIVTKIDEHNNCIVSGTTTIDCVLHRIENRFVFCNRTLNHKSWGYTPQKEKCNICFPNIDKKEELKQLTLF